MRQRKIPSYRHHKARNLAVVTLDGRDVYLGPYNSPESRTAYEQQIAAWLQTNHQPPEPGAELTVCELMAEYITFAAGYYVKHARPTREFGCISEALREVRRMHEATMVTDFGPRALKCVRDEMVQRGWSRKYINKQVGRIVRMFKWGVSEELVPPSVSQALNTVSGLRRGRTEAPDHDPVMPVADEVVEATLPHLPPVVADMVRLQRLSGSRPGEITVLRFCDVERSGNVWAFCPATHKTEHHGRRRVIFYGPKSQSILLKYADRDESEYCFSPAESERLRRAELHRQRKTPLHHGNRPRKRKINAKRTPASHYTTDSYRRAIHRVCDRHSIPKWSPNQLRHTAATEIRSRFGLEAAQTVLGHASAAVTEIYAERDLALAASIARELG